MSRHRRESNPEEYPKGRKGGGSDRSLFLFGRLRETVTLKIEGSVNGPVFRPQSAPLQEPELIIDGTRSACETMRRTPSSIDDNYATPELLALVV